MTLPGTKSRRPIELTRFNGSHYDALRSAFVIGQKLGQYSIQEQVGAGGMGVVYKAHDERLQRDVAIKVLSQSLTGQEERRHRVLAARASAVAFAGEPKNAKAAADSRGSTWPGSTWPQIWR